MSIANKKELLTELKSLGISELAITYSGSGDSGAVDSITASRDDGVHRDIQDFAPVTMSPMEMAQRVSAKLLNQKDQNLRDRLEDFAYKLLESLDVGDWCNNEGGDGTITVNVDDEEIKVAHRIAYISYEHENYTV